MSEWKRFGLQDRIEVGYCWVSCGKTFWVAWWSGSDWRWTSGMPGGEKIKFYMKIEEPELPRSDTIQSIAEEMEGLRKRMAIVEKEVLGG